MKIRPHPVPLRVDDQGAIRVGQTRVLLDLVVDAFNEGATPEEIVLRYDALQLADVYSALGYYLDHRAQVDAYVEEGRRAAERLRADVNSRPAIQSLRERLLARQLRTKDVAASG